jgi:DNA repair exonuclease SbcCD ATPase subunit
MKNLTTYMAYGLGGTGLIAGSFVLFAALSGTPLSKVAGVGRLFPEDPSDPVTSSQDTPNPEDELQEDRRTSEQVLESARGPLHAFVMPSPFSATDLEELEGSLENRMTELELRDRELDRREAQLEEDRLHYIDLLTELEQMRTSLLEMDDERVAKAEELDRDISAFTESEKQSYRAMAELYKAGKAKDLAPMLMKVYTPDKAALILAALPQDQVGLLLGEIFNIDEALGAAYQEAYRQVSRLK